MVETTVKNNLTQGTKHVTSVLILLEQTEEWDETRG